LAEVLNDKTKFKTMAENSRFPGVSDEFLDNLLNNSIPEKTKKSKKVCFSSRVQTSYVKQLK
jgi:hypothetical protein